MYNVYINLVFWTYNSIDTVSNLVGILESPSE